MKELALKGTRATRHRPSRSGAWLRGAMGSSHEASFNLRENSPLSPNTLCSLELVAQDR